MSENPAYRQLMQTAQKWRDLAERRRAHFVDLYESGRWKHYYDEQEFLFQLREISRVAETWAAIAPGPVNAVPPHVNKANAKPVNAEPAASAEPGVLRRTAA